MLQLPLVVSLPWATTVQLFVKSISVIPPPTVTV
jgi:hypothetical protein